MKERKRTLLLAVLFFLSGKDVMAASYSAWSTTYPSRQQGIESKTQYRYSDYVDQSQWVLTKSGSVDYVPSWPAALKEKCQNETVDIFSGIGVKISINKDQSTDVWMTITTAEWDRPPSMHFIVKTSLRTHGCQVKMQG